MKNNRKKPGLIKLLAGIIMTLSGMLGISYLAENHIFAGVIFYLLLIFGAALILIFSDELSVYRKRRNRRSNKMEVM